MICCTQCNYSASLAETLKGHMTIHCEVRPFPCNQCSKSFKKESYLRKHIKNRHITDREKSHVCSHCKYSTYTARLLKDHLVVHGTERPLNCSECGKSFKLPQHLKQHILTHNAIERTHECSICKKMFTAIVTSCCPRTLAF